MEITPEKLSYLFPVGVLVSLLLVGLIGYAVKRLEDYLKTKTGIEKYEELRQQTLMVVRRLQQVGENFGYSNEQKKEIAVLAVLRISETLKLGIDENEADMLVEWGVNVMKATSKALSAEG